MHFLKAVMLMLTKVLVQAYTMSMAIKSLAYYVALFDHGEDSFFNEVLNIWYRGLWRLSPPDPLTLTQATLAGWAKMQLHSGVAWKSHKMVKRIKVLDKWVHFHHFWEMSNKSSVPLF